MSPQSSQFPTSQPEFHHAMSATPILLNGMKVVFDQKASVYPVALENRTSLRLDSKKARLAEQKSLLSKSFTRTRAAANADRAQGDGIVGNFDAVTVQADWSNKDLEARAQYNQDIKLWLNTIYPFGDLNRSLENTEKAKILQRIFSVLRFAGLQYRLRESEDDWQPWDKPIAAALSHGGRVLIRVRHQAYGKVYPQPKIQHQHRLWNWIVTGKFDTSSKPKINSDAGLLTRAAATHGINFEAAGPVEVPLKTSRFSGNFGMNVPLGGENGTNAQGESIQADGLHGHLYLRYDHAPQNDDNWDCAIMIGCETTRPKDFEGAKGKGHLGTSHSLTGGSQKVSATGGGKWQEVPDANGVPGKIDCARVDVDSLDELLAITTFGNANLVRDDSPYVDQINQFSQVDVRQGMFELHPDYRDTVKDWLRFIPASGDLFTL